MDSWVYWRFPFIIAALGLIGVFFGFLAHEASKVRDNLQAKLNFTKEQDNQNLINGLKAVAAESKQKLEKIRKELAPRVLTETQRAKFIASLTDVPKGKINVVYVSAQDESQKFAEQIRALIISAGFTSDRLEYSISYFFKPPSPWYIAVIVRKEQAPPYAIAILRAFKEIEIDALGGDGSDIGVNLGECKIYVGGK